MHYSLGTHGLGGWAQRAVVNGVITEEWPVTSEVPPGLVLGPGYIFNIFLYPGFGWGEGVHHHSVCRYYQAGQECWLAEGQEGSTEGSGQAPSMAQGQHYKVQHSEVPGLAVGTLGGERLENCPGGKGSGNAGLQRPEFLHQNPKSNFQPYSGIQVKKHTLIYSDNTFALCSGKQPTKDTFDYY